MACVPSPPLFWYKPETLPATAVPITDWPDSSGNGYDLTAVGGLEPVSDGEALPGAVFTGVEVLEGPTDVELNFSDGYTIFLVMEEPDSTSRTFMGKINAAGGWDAGRYDVGIDNLSIYSADYLNPDRYYTDEFAPCWAGAFDTSLHVYMIQMIQVGDVGSFRVTCRRDGWSESSQRLIGDNEHSPVCMPVATNEGTPAKLTIGDVYLTSLGLKGTLKEVMGYAGELNDAGILLTENYLLNKFSVSSPRRTYTTPTEVGRASYSDTWTGIAAVTGTQAGDVEILMYRSQPDGTEDAIDFPNPVSGVPFISNLPTYSVVIGGDGPNGTRIRFAYRVVQGAGESTDFQNAVGQTVPVRPCTIEIVAYRGLALGADGAPYYGNNLPSLGFFYQDFTRNYSWNGFEYQPPVDHSADPVFSSHENGMMYQIFVGDEGTPSITSTVLAEGSTAQIVEGSGAFWFLGAFVLEADSEEADPVPPPSCAPVSYNCTEAGCVDPGDGTGTFATLEECEAACGVTPSWNCIDGVCTDPGDGTGEFATLLECQTSGCGGPTYTATTERFDAGEGSQWYVIPVLSDSGDELRAKNVKAAYAIGRLTNASVMGYAYDVGEPINMADLEAGVRTNTKNISRPQPLPDSTEVAQTPRKPINIFGTMHTCRLEGDDRGKADRDRIEQITYEVSRMGVRR